MGSKCYHANNTFFMHFVSSQIRDDRSQRVGVMCHTLWCHLSSLTYELSIFKNLGGWQPWVKINNFSQVDFMMDLGYKKKILTRRSSNLVPPAGNNQWTLFFSQYLVSFVRFTEVVACHVWIFCYSFCRFIMLVAFAKLWAKWLDY